jgi:hypothetical protein
MSSAAGLPDFSLYMIPKNGKNVPNEHKMYHMVIIYPKCLFNIPNGHKIHQKFSISGPPKFSQIGIFCLKTNHLATLKRDQATMLDRFHLLSVNYLAIALLYPPIRATGRVCDQIAQDAAQTHFGQS